MTTLLQLGKSALLRDTAKLLLLQGKTKRTVAISHLFSESVNTGHSDALTGGRTVQSKDPFNT